MKILLSNDDGILAPGLAALYAAVADLGEVTVVAPASPQSAAGQGITVLHPLVVERVHVKGAIDFWGHSVDGRPADCTRLALRKLLPAKPDLVLSGINNGANVGMHVFYSGTVAAAAEGTMSGVPSVAFSAALSEEIDFARIARLCRWVLDRLLAGGLLPRDLINVNIPALGPDLPRGVRVAPQSRADLLETYHHHLAADGQASYKLDEYAFIGGEVDSDVIGIEEGYITVTPLHVDRTDRERLTELQDVDWERGTGGQALGNRD